MLYVLLHGHGPTLMLASRTCRALPRHARTRVFKHPAWSEVYIYMRWALTIGPLTPFDLPNDKTPHAQKCGLVYQVECPGCPLTHRRDRQEASYDDGTPFQPQEHNNSCAQTSQHNQGQCYLENTFGLREK